MSKVEAPAPPEISGIRQSTNGTSPAPVFGGTLNATTQQAAENKRLSADDMQNRAILSHGEGKYIGDSQPTFQSPLNGAGVRDEPPVVDLFAQSNPTSRGATLPPLPQMPDILSAPATPPPPPTPDFSQLPPMPPQMPDFNQLPPDPAADASLAPDQPLGGMLPPSPVGADVPSTPPDPGQFKIPGQ